MKRLIEAWNYEKDINNEAKHYMETIGLPMFRGTEAEGHIGFKFRTAPRDTYRAIHNEINAKTKEKFGIPLRSLVFTTSNQDEASSYGPLKVVVPKEDNYRIFANPSVLDLTVQEEIKVSNIVGDFQRALENVSNKYDDSIVEIVEEYISSGRVEHLVKAHSNEETYLDAVKSINTVIDGDLRSLLSEKGDYEDLYKEVVEITRSDAEHITKLVVDEYVDEIVEITAQTQMSEMGRDVEFMVYAPEGFIVGTINEVGDAFGDDLR